MPSFLCARQEWSCAKGKCPWHPRRRPITLGDPDTCPLWKSLIRAVGSKSSLKCWLQAGPWHGVQIFSCNCIWDTGKFMSLSRSYPLFTQHFIQYSVTLVAVGLGACTAGANGFRDNSKAAWAWRAWSSGEGAQASTCASRWGSSDWSECQSWRISVFEERNHAKINLRFGWVVGAVWAQSKINSYNMAV